MNTEINLAAPNQQKRGFILRPSEEKQQRRIVSDGRTLRALQRAGHISEPIESLRPKGKRWGGGYCYVEAGTKNHFSHQGRFYWVAYRDGCFLPFVFTTTQQ